MFRSAFRSFRGGRIMPFRCGNLRQISSEIKPKISVPDTMALLIQKNLIQKNNSLYNYGTGTVRCTIFDEKGRVIVSSMDMKREDLVIQHALLPRDLRKIEKSGNLDLVSTILVRRNGILVNLLNIKALIKSDGVIIFDNGGSNLPLDSKTQLDLISDLQLRLSSYYQLEMQGDELPYEFRALEAIFISALSSLTREMKVLNTISKSILQDLEYKITKNKLRLLLVQNKKLTIFHKKALLVREMIDNLLEQDDDLCSMYLTDKHCGKERVEDDHTEIEMLLETYYSHIDEIVQKAESSISNVKTTEEIINIILDSNRNQLMLLGIKFSMGMLSLGGAIFLGSLYGMNLENFIEETDYGFGLVTVISLFSLIFLFKLNIKSLRSLQKLSLFGRDKPKIK
ncbi:hypothetical protein Kpol_299p4 [Vanderwaltozyma polyspora DSM 70294]|uniref:Magnesium transporter n=1 Tax=Vanderwaltozyma polyspora (strain ATCC 22028 / DSM 70294 / BCRC 21397 / CBS 2163 / NBRC 10782 / NRRL Y-8283 / UCD 57-17) TaxID=436907 RepID=A7TSW2_VANPO|nr:uncharacterized protein Kpol_299p4 [Vanderwaltozyma polyspora DSM 70294]EDO14644.1 hypothetical protein Kpol_299p4 [Vanderwaltozyma polyspora DSM 70294]